MQVCDHLNMMMYICVCVCGSDGSITIKIASQNFAVTIVSKKTAEDSNGHMDMETKVLLKYSRKLSK